MRRRRRWCFSWFSVRKWANEAKAEQDPRKKGNGASVDAKFERISPIKSSAIATPIVAQRIHVIPFARSSSWKASVSIEISLSRSFCGRNWIHLLLLVSPMGRTLLIVLAFNWLLNFLIFCSLTLIFPHRLPHCVGGNSRIVFSPFLCFLRNTL